MNFILLIMYYLYHKIKDIISIKSIFVNNFLNIYIFNT